MGSAPPIDEDEEDEEVDEDSCSQQDKEGNVTTTPTPETDTEVDAQFFVSEDDPDSTVNKNGKASPQRKLPIIPHSMLHTSISIPENVTTSAGRNWVRNLPNGRRVSAPCLFPSLSSGRSYDLQERRRTGNMTGTSLQHYQYMPTDESEAQTLATVDLDGIKSHRFEDSLVCGGTWLRKALKVRWFTSARITKSPAVVSAPNWIEPHMRGDHGPVTWTTGFVVPNS